ncbi:MAG: hypothetical protein N2439_15505, partial [Anaerolineae bacterium]|nr:hypothetical protein [Anaerolineae bacterium]
MPLTKSLLVDSAMILALLLIGVIGYKLSPLRDPKADLVIAPSPACDLAVRPCSAELPTGGRLEFAVLPRPIPVAAPLNLTVTLEGLSAERVAVDFAGVEMNMGFIRPTLSAAGPGRFSGAATLPVCVTGRMLWQATVLIEGGGRRLAVPFRFTAG